MPCTGDIIARPDGHCTAALKIRPGRHNQQVLGRIEHAAFAGGGKGNGLQNVALHVLQPKVIGLAEIKIHLPFTIGLVQSQHLRGLFLALGRNHPARVEPVAIGGVEALGVGGEMHDLRAAGPFSLRIKIARIIALPPFGRGGSGKGGEA